MRVSWFAKTQRRETDKSAYIQLHERRSDLGRAQVSPSQQARSSESVILAFALARISFHFTRALAIISGFSLVRLARCLFPCPLFVRAVGIVWVKAKAGSNEERKMEKEVWRDASRQGSSYR